MTSHSNVARRSKDSPQTNPTEYTPFFEYRSATGGGKELHCEGVSLAQIAAANGTPAYIYSRASIEQAFRRLDRAFGKFPHALGYSLKANSNLSVLRILAKLGSTKCIVSGGSFDRLPPLRVAGKRRVFSGGR